MLHFRDRRGTILFRFVTEISPPQRSYVWTEDLSGMIFLAAQKLSGSGEITKFCFRIIF